MAKQKVLVWPSQVCFYIRGFPLQQLPDDTEATDVTLVLTTESLFCPFEETQQQTANGSMKGRRPNMDEHPQSRRKCFHFI